MVIGVTHTPRHARLSTQKRHLFHSWSFFILAPPVPLPSTNFITRSELECLIEGGGGNVLTKPPNSTSIRRSNSLDNKSPASNQQQKVVILFDPNLDSIEFASFHSHYRLPTTWLLNAISHFTISPLPLEM